MNNNKYSDLKIVQYPEKLQAFRENRITPPLYLRVKPTNRCNHACRFCTFSDGTKRPSDHGQEDHLQGGMHGEMNERDVIPTEKMIEILDDFKAMGVKAVTYSGGGEPLIHPGICRIMERTLENGIALSAITNGQSLNGERAEILRQGKWVRVSIDYTDARTMADSRNVSLSSFAGVMKNLEFFATIKPAKCDLGVNYIVTRYNCTGLIEFSKLLKGIGVQNIRFSPVWVEGFQAYHAAIKESVEAQLQEITSLCDSTFSVNSTYKLDDNSKKLERPFKRCLYSTTVPVIGADQCVYACTDTAYTEHGKLGSLADKRFIDFWGSPEHIKKWKDLDPSKVCRHECKAHRKIDFFEQLVDMHEDPFV